VLFHRKAIWMDLLALLVGASAYSLLRTLPYAGWVIGLLVTAAGAGSAWLAFRRRPKVLVVESETVIEKRSTQTVPAKGANKKAEKRSAKRQSPTVKKSN